MININTIVNLISSTKTETGLVVKCVVDNPKYETGLKISDDEFETIDIEKADINPSWNYVIKGLKKGINLGQFLSYVERVILKMHEG